MFRIPSQVRFWYFLFFDITSLACTLFVLWFLLMDRTNRQALNNHVIIILLIIGLIYELTDISFHLYNDHFGVPWSTSPNFYIFWVFIDYSLYSLQIALFAWASIERHILIFHDQWVSTRKKRLFIHYLPIASIIIFYLIYYSIVYFATPCSYSFDGYLNGGIYIPCAFDRTFLATWDLFVHQIIPTLIIAIFCVGLLIRVIRQKARMRRSNRWRENRRMTVQLLSISIIYLVFNFPWVIVIFAYQCGLPDYLAFYGIIYGKFLLYNIIFFFPYVCYFSLRNVRVKIVGMIFYHRRARQVGPQATTRNTTQPAGIQHNPNPVSKKIEHTQQHQ